MTRQRIFTSIVLLATVAILAVTLAGHHPVIGQSEPTPGGPPPALTVSLDAAATGEPISPYVYGMFIEHQGRCIYGGIWAEMIEDRKFYYPVNTYFPYGESKNKSPWRALPFDTEVRMLPDHAFVGEHSPLVILDGQKPRGILQDRLALRRGKEYTGRIVLSASDLATVEASLVWGPGPGDRQTVTIGPLTQEYATSPLAFTVEADTDDGRLEIIGQGEGSFTVGAVSLMPADNVQGIRADTLALLQRTGRHDLSLAGRLLRQRLPLARRHRRPGPTSTPVESGVLVGGRGIQRLRPR